MWGSVSVGCGEHIRMSGDESACEVWSGACGGVVVGCLLWLPSHT